MLTIIKPRTALIIALAIAPGLAWSGSQSDTTTPEAAAEQSSPTPEMSTEKTACHHQGMQHGKTTSEGHGSRMTAMKHANPMPNLMKVMVKMGDQLDLSEEQSEDLAKWREAHQGSMRATVTDLTRMEAELGKAALDGTNRARLMGMYSDIARVRRDIVTSKIACRDNLKRILTEEQFNKVIALYAAHY